MFSAEIALLLYWFKCISRFYSSLLSTSTNSRTHQNIFQDLLEPRPVAADPVDQGVEQRGKDLGLLVGVRGESWKRRGNRTAVP